MVVSSARLSVHVKRGRNDRGAGYDAGGIGANGATAIVYSERLGPKRTFKDVLQYNQEKQSAQLKSKKKLMQMLGCQQQEQDRRC